MQITRRHFLRASIASPFLLIPSLWSKSTTGKSPITKSELKVLSRLARCIAMVETGGNDDLQGKRGERSKYQISRVVWKQHYPGRPFIECYGINADECAIRHLTWLYKNLPYESNFWTAFAWNAGLEKTCDELVSPVVSDTPFNFATRVINLYQDKNFK